MTFRAKFSALVVSMMPGDQFNSTYLGCACQECFLHIEVSCLLTGKKHTNPD